MRNVHFWTDDKVAETTRLHGRGLSAAEIARRIGAPTRNTVIGKLNRLGLRSKRTQEQARRDDVVVQRALARNRPKAERTERQPAPARVERPVPAPPDCAPVTLLDRLHGQCAFPVSGNGVNTLFCAGGVAPGRGYCRHHLSVMWARAA